MHQTRIYLAGWI